MNAQEKTFTEQQERVTDKHPQITLVPSTDDADEQHEHGGKEKCGATANMQGLIVSCSKAARHAGDHKAGGRTWRPRSGD